MSEVLEVGTPTGPARAHVHGSHRPGQVALVLGHGAGGGIDAADLAALAAALPARGVDVVLVEQPWRVAGRRIAGPPAQLDRAWVAVLADPALRAVARLDGVGRLVVGGRSAGARVACRTAVEVGARAVVALAFPLHPPGRGGRDEYSRVGELLGCPRAGLATLVVQGSRDAFGGPGELPAEVAGLTVVGVPGADHSFRVPRRAELTQDAALELLVARVAAFLGV